MNIFEFMTESPVLTFFLAWIIGDAVVCVFSRIIRHLNIRKHGYPPPHCDADGDLLKDDEP